MKERVIDAGLAFFRATGLHRHVASWTAGRGAILTLHHVRPAVPHEFAPNSGLEIEPSFLDAVLGRVRERGYDIVTLDEALRRLTAPASRRFVAVTVDDGYRDLPRHALPIFERHAAPFTAYVTTGFVDRTARLWWLELEAAVRVLSRIAVTVGAATIVLTTMTNHQKTAAFAILYRRLRALPEAAMRTAIGDLAAQAGIDTAGLPSALCMDHDEVRALARHPLCTIGAHTVSHPMLAKHDAATMWREIADGRAGLESTIGLPVRHLAYPVGDPGSAGAREFAAATALGFSTAVTTRPGVLFAAHAARPTALPRVSLNGRWQSLAMLDVLLSGAPFAFGRGAAL